MTVKVTKRWARIDRDQLLGMAALQIRLGTDAPIARGVVLGVADDRTHALMWDREAAGRLDCDTEYRTVIAPPGERMPRDVRVGVTGYLTLRRGRPFFTPLPARRRAA